MVSGHWGLVFTKTRLIPLSHWPKNLGNSQVMAKRHGSQQKDSLKTPGSEILGLNLGKKKGYSRIDISVRGSTRVIRSGSQR